MLIPFFFITIVSSSQVTKSIEIQTLEFKRTKLESEVIIKQDSLKLINKKIDQLMNESLLKAKPEGLLYETILPDGGRIRKSDNPNSGILTVLKSNDTIYLTDYSDGYWVVIKGQYFGYINEMYIKSSPELDKFKNLVLYRQGVMKNKVTEELKKKELEERNKANAVYLKQQEERKTLLTRKYGKVTGDKIFNNYYWIGMTTEMARESLGSSENINKSVGAWGVNEQWVYSGLYLYFENGIMTSYQTSR